MDTLPFSHLSWVGLRYRTATRHLKTPWYLVQSVCSHHLVTPWLEVLLIVCLVCTANQLHLYLYPITDGTVNLNKSAVSLGCLLCLHIFYYTEILDIPLKKKLTCHKSLDLEIASNDSHWVKESKTFLFFNLIQKIILAKQMKKKVEIWGKFY